jgi:hypothetical protein
MRKIVNPRSVSTEVTRCPPSEAIGGDPRSAVEPTESGTDNISVLFDRAGLILLDAPPALVG